MLRKLFFAVLLGIVCCTALAGCGGGDPAPKENKLAAYASFYPVAEFTRQVGGKHVEVTTLIPDGVEPHDWEPTAKDLEGLKKASLFLYNGGVESWAEKAIEALGRDKTENIEVAHGLMTETFEEDHHEDKEEHHADKDSHEDKDHHADKDHREEKEHAHHHHEGADPHVWVSPKRAMEEVKVIAEALSRKDPAHKAEYEKNAAAYLEKLSNLDTQLRELGKTVKRKEFITTHAAFGYLAKDYGFRQIPIMGLSPEAEPAPRDMANLVNLIREKGIKFVFFETLVSPKVAQTIADNAGVGTLVLNPLEGLTAEEKKQGADYISVMQQNIENLKKALKE